MKVSKLLIAAIGISLTLGLSACDKSNSAPAADNTAPRSIAPVASVSVDAAASAAPATVAVAANTAAPAATTAQAPAAGDAAPNPGGEKVFKSVCFMCHQTGAAGAPIFGNKDDWAPRIAKGKPTLYKHAMEGFTGNNGSMPPRGGNPSLKDDEVKAAVDFMVAKAQ